MFAPPDPYRTASPSALKPERSAAIPAFSGFVTMLIGAAFGQGEGTVFLALLFVRAERPFFRRGWE